MPNVTVFDVNGNKVSELALADSIFAIEPNTSAMHLAVVAYLANQRQGTQSTLTRSEVSGGGKKPWRQKGSGRARQGSTRAPQWYHGGIAHGPKPRTYGLAVNKKVPLGRVRDAMFVTKLVQEESLSHRSRIRKCDKRTHQICVAAVYLVWSRKILQAFL